MKDEQIENRVVTLHGMGWSIRRIALELRISRKRIRRILVSQSVLSDTTPEERIRHKRRRASKLDPYKSYIGDLLERYPDITGQRVYDHLKEKGFDARADMKTVSNMHLFVVRVGYFRTREEADEMVERVTKVTGEKAIVVILN